MDRHLHRYLFIIRRTPAPIVRFFNAYLSPPVFRYERQGDTFCTFTQTDGMQTNFFHEAQTYGKRLVAFRRYLHQNAETGFRLPKTIAYVESQLRRMGYRPQRCGKAGIVALANAQATTKKTFLLRADMDALPIQEQTSLDFAAKNGAMHACGHDMHTAMLLGAAYVLKRHERLLNGRVKLLFQPAEETLEGAKDVLRNGVLTAPRVHAAAMLHVLTATDLPTGTLLVADGGYSAPSADFFTIEVQGKGCHGSMPHDGVDALQTAAHIVLALQELSARELALSDRALLTIGALQAGETGNVIADRAVLKGTLRTFDPDLRQRLRRRIREVSTAIARAFRAHAAVLFESGAPALYNDPDLSKFALCALKEHTSDVLSTAAWGEKGKSGGSEDFAYIAERTPALLLSIAAGKREDGYAYPLHHPKTDFDERALPIGAAAYATLAARWLSDAH